MTEQVEKEVQSKKARTMIGRVVSNKSDKTIVVLVERQVKHKRFGKFIKLSTKIHAHDAQNECSIGDLVVINETKPFSKTKSWVLSSIREKSQ